MQLNVMHCGGGSRQFSERETGTCLGAKQAPHARTSPIFHPFCEAAPNVDPPSTRAFSIFQECSTTPWFLEGHDFDLCTPTPPPQPAFLPLAWPRPGFVNFVDTQTNVVHLLKEEANV